MTSTAQWNRFSPGSTLALAVVSGLLLGLVALCCRAGEHPAAHEVDHASVVLADPGADSPPVTGEGGSGDGCDHPAAQADAIVASARVTTRDSAAVVASGPLWVGDGGIGDSGIGDSGVGGGAVRALVGGGGRPARAPASQLLCVMRT